MTGPMTAAIICLFTLAAAAGWLAWLHLWIPRVRGDFTRNQVSLWRRHALGWALTSGLLGTLGMVALIVGEATR